MWKSDSRRESRWTKKTKVLLANNEGVDIIVFASGGTPSAAEDVINKIWKASFSDEELNKIPHFYMQSGLNYGKMGMADRLIMKTLAKMLNRKKDKIQMKSDVNKLLEAHTIYLLEKTRIVRLIAKI